VVGLGAQIFDGSGRAQITGLSTSSSLTGIAASATEIGGGFDGNWSMRATAVCADPLPGLQLATSQAGSFGKQAKATARCPDGTVAIGQGFSVFGKIVGGVGQIRIPRLEAAPLPDGGTGARVEAFETNLSASSWTLNALAICAALSPPPARVVEFREASSPNSVLATCPTGTGPGMLSGGFITEPREDVLMTGVGIRISVQSGSLRLTKAAARAESVFPAPIRAFSTAVCASA
jgi:hypothetical protein